MRADLIRAVLECGVDDLDMLDYAGADMYETVDHLRENGMAITLDSIMGEVFREGIRRMDESVKEFQAELECMEDADCMTREEQEKLKIMRDYKLEPLEDFGYYTNCIDSYLYFAPHPEDGKEYKEAKCKAYQDLFLLELQDLESYTGFCIQW